MQLPAHISILNVGQDNLFAGLPDCRVDHVSTGASIVPMADRAGGGGLRRWPGILSRIGRAQYDLIVLPVADFCWNHDASRIKRAVRWIAASTLRRRPIAGPCNKLLARRNTTVIVLDRYDTSDTFDDFLECVTSARYYFKTNLRESDSDRVHPFAPGRECAFKSLPYWISTEKYQVPFRSDKDIDVFFAGMVNSDERRVAVERVRRLDAEGYRVKIVEGRLPFAEYLDLMSRSWLTLSPAGCGYNGFRHYESMLVGSVPVINVSDPPIVSDFVHGENCLLYSQRHGDLIPLIKQALSDRPRLQKLARRLPEFVAEQHSLRGVGQYVLRESLKQHADFNSVSSEAASFSTPDRDESRSDCEPIVANLHASQFS